MNGFRMVWSGFVVLMSALAIAPAAMAHQSPAGCTGSDPRVEFSNPPAAGEVFREADGHEFTVAVSNDAEGACDATLEYVRASIAAGDGTSSEVLTLAVNLEVPAGTTRYLLPATIANLTDFDDSVFRFDIRLTWRARVHSGAQDGFSEGQDEISVNLTRPRAKLDVSADAVVGFAPLTVNFTYRLTNISSASPVDPFSAPSLLPGTPGTREVVTDSGCGPVTYVSGDLPGSDLVSLDPAGSGSTVPETWVFTCTRIFGQPGVFSGVANATGLSSVDGLPWPALSSTTDITVLSPDLVVDKTHDGNFIAGDNGTYTLRVSNSGNHHTTGNVTLMDQLPAGLTATAMAGAGWQCDLELLSCVRSDPLDSGSSYPDVTLSVRVSESPPGDVINTATVSGGGEPPGVTGNNFDQDPTRIRTPGKPQALPDNRFKIRSVETRPGGKVLIRVRTRASGRIVADDAHKKPDLLQRSSRKTAKSGVFSLTVKANRRLNRRLIRNGKPAAVQLKITFTPHGGLSSSRSRKVTFRL